MIRPFILAVSIFAATSAFAQTPVVTPTSASLVLGTDIAAKTLPDGTYERMMSGSMIKMMQGISNQTITTPIAPFLKAAGLPAADVSKLGRTTLKQAMEIVDPAYEQRMNLTMSVMMSEIGKMMTQFEPAMREGLAHAYATRFTLPQLNDIDHFLNTPSGLAFASQSMTIASDPVVVEKMQAFMPTLMQSLPALIKKTMAATDGLPKPKTPETLTDSDRTKLAQLFAADPSAQGTTSASAPGNLPPRKLAPDMEVGITDNIAQYFDADRYPPAALRAGSQGRVVAMISVNSAGKGVSCAIASSSGSDVLDAETCKIATDQIRYSPATDHQARPTAGVFKLPVRWVLPKDAPVAPSAAPQAVMSSH